MYVTQFDAVWTRTEYPYVDEPYAKAVFTVHTIHPQSLTAISNMHVSSIDTDYGHEHKRTKTNFNQSLIMSSYLMAEVVGQFELIEEFCNDEKLPMWIYTLPGQIDQANFTLESAVRAIEYLSEFIQIQFQVFKLVLFRT
ncbi:MAG: hypothetical protein EZS28_055400, partial [Streblomastix strix]